MPQRPFPTGDTVMSTNPRDLPFDAQLDRARRGDMRVWGLMLQRSRDSLLKYATAKMAGRLQCKAEPTDLVQDTFFEAQQALPRFVGLMEEQFQAWLLR